MIPESRRASPVDEYSRCNQPSRKRTRCDNNQRKTSIARQPICERRDNQSRQYEKQLDSHRAGCNRERQRDTKHTGKEGNVEEETSERELRFLHSTRPHNRRFLRHRPERSERCLNYGNCTKAMARCLTAKVCRRPSVKTMLAATGSGIRREGLRRFVPLNCEWFATFFKRVPSLVVVGCEFVIVICNVK